MLAKRGDGLAKHGALANAVVGDRDGALVVRGGGRAVALVGRVERLAPLGELEEEELDGLGVDLDLRRRVLVALVVIVVGRVVLDARGGGGGGAVAVAVILPVRGPAERAPQRRRELRVGRRVVPVDVQRLGARRELPPYVSLTLSAKQKPWIMSSSSFDLAP